MMQDVKQAREMLRTFRTTDLWMELARRFKVQYGKMQMAFHAGKPSAYVHLDLRVPTESEDKPISR